MTRFHIPSTGPIFSAPLKLVLTLKTNVKGWEKMCKFKVKVRAENMGPGPPYIYVFLFVSFLSRISSQHSGHLIFCNITPLFVFRGDTSKPRTLHELTFLYVFRGSIILFSWVIKLGDNDVEIYIVCAPSLIDKGQYLDFPFLCLHALCVKIRIVNFFINVSYMDLLFFTTLLLYWCHTHLPFSLTSVSFPFYYSHSCFSF